MDCQFLGLEIDFEMSETCELLSWYLRGCNKLSLQNFHDSNKHTSHRMGRYE